MDSSPAQGRFKTNSRFRRYIIFDGGTTPFWEGLRSTLLQAEGESPCEDVLLKRWPKLKAVIERTHASASSCVHESPIHRVWIAPRNAFVKPSDNPVARITIILYGNRLWIARVARESLFIANVRFWIDHQLVPAAVNTSPGPTGLRTGSNWRRRTLPLELEPDAGLSDSMLLAVDFYVLTDPRERTKAAMKLKSSRLYDLCIMSIKALDTRFLSLFLECRDALEISFWMSLVSLLIQSVDTAC